MENKQEHKMNWSIFRKLRIAILVLAAVIVGVWMWKTFMADDKNVEKKTIITESSLEKVVKISDLSTYKAVYNGVAHIYDKNIADKILYHVSYESEIKIGIDTDKIKVAVDEENKKVTVTLPEIKINDVIVDIASLDYIFEDKSADTEDVSNEAYQACIEDAQNDSESNAQIIDLARANCENMIKALINPLLEQEDYSLKIN